MNKIEAHQFLEIVKTKAPELSMHATAKALQISFPAFQSKLLKALSILGEVPPQFFQGRKKASNQFNVQVQAAGRGGAGKKIVIPSAVFEQLGWEINDPIVMKIVKKKLTLERS